MKFLNNLFISRLSLQVKKSSRHRDLCSTTCPQRAQKVPLQEHCYGGNISARFSCLLKGGSAFLSEAVPSTLLKQVFVINATNLTCMNPRSHVALECAAARKRHSIELQMGMESGPSKREKTDERRSVDCFPRIRYRCSNTSAWAFRERGQMLST